MTDRLVNNSRHIGVPGRGRRRRVGVPDAVRWTMGDPTSLQHVRQLLAQRLPGTRLGFAVRPPPATLPTGVRRLDAALGGGLPLGETTELVGPGAGRGGGTGLAQVLQAVLRRMAAEGRFVAFVDGADSLDVDALEPAEMARLLWVRCRDVAGALSAADVLLRDRNFPLVVLDLGLNPATEWRRVHGGVWARLDRLRAQQHTTLLVATPRPLVAGAARRVQVVPGGRAALGVADTGRSPGEVLEDLEFEVLRAMGERGRAADAPARAPAMASAEPWALTG